VDRGKVEATVVNTRAGTVEACQRTKLSTIMGGRIEYLGVKEGDKVKKGQLLLKLWNDDQKAQQGTGRGAAGDGLAARQGGLHHGRQFAARGRAPDLAEEKGLRFRRPRGRGEERGRCAQRGLRDGARRRRPGGGARRGDESVEQGRMVLYAPFDGTVAKIVGELGEYSTPSPPGVPTPPAIDLIDESCLYVKAPMDEVDAPKIQAGLPVRVSLDALPKQPLPGKVRRVAPYVLAVEKQARTVDVEVDFERPANVNLLVGYSADVEIVLSVRENVLRVPTAALIEGSRVMVLGADSGRLEERKVKAGLANWEYTEIIEGLAEGERIVTSLEREGVKVGARATAVAPSATLWRQNEGKQCPPAPLPGKGVTMFAPLRGIWMR
jgi:HlyD family secretion protein